ncbi:MAG: 16S rRNA (cytosine(967)-C(5))-methyltransferase RsmB [Zhongshania sp.]|uniref:16S rRNA (cytosine(967)-C(5))-methyltransferase RsmB n=1 Tax=Zhongshania sp. TaxID=1971902 RepID=UPI0026029540|nr:16S rRNA (cytosine(967)-C(5))-methyltransferase RsmB [Zhongshania sp.]MDF1692471.1 16S rRNA (cytosine(967)-C(5))-methyltransferase RsmB [Zhongshania sp.]
MKCPRVAAARCLASIAQEGSSLSRQLPRGEQDLDPAQRPLYRELCYGTLRYYWRLDAGLKPLFSKGLKPKDSDVKMLILIGAYQLFYTRIPPHAAINSAVEGCRSLGKKWAAGMANAILRRCQREQDSLFKDLKPAAEAAFPAWLYQAIAQAWPDQLTDIMAASNAHPPFCLRLNRLHQDRDSYLQRLAEQEMNASPCEFAPYGIRLDKACAVDKLPGFADGHISVQDEAAQLCTQLLDLHAGQRVLDACAAPGGKTGAILEAEPALAELVALDIDEQRLSRISDNLQRLQLSASLVAADAADLDSWWDGRHFDRILLDAPCSATGVIRRNPDIKLNRVVSDIAPLCRLQASLLDQLWQCLAPGGVFVYATCSLLPAENEAQISAFLSRQAGAELLPIAADWGVNRDGCRQLFPQEQGHDGFFYAVLRKKL